VWPVHTCLDCGNSDMHVHVVDGACIHVCGLCGARFGDRRAVQSLQDADEARQQGVDAEVWPLVRALRRLPGLTVRAATAADAGLGTLPRVELGVSSGDALVQLENLARSLVLGAAVLQRHWVIEVECQHHLCFVLKPRHAGGAVSRADAREASQDLEVLGRHLDRDGKLRWWRHAGGAPDG
jgi:hypothetical protein